MTDDITPEAVERFYAWKYSGEQRTGGWSKANLSHVEFELVSASDYDALAARLVEVEEMKRLLAMDKIDLRGELAGVEGQIEASQAALMDLCRKHGMPEDTDMCLQWLDERLAKLADAEAFAQYRRGFTGGV